MLKKIKAVYSSMNFRNRMMLISFFMVFIAVCALMMFYFDRYNRKMQSDNADSVLQALKQAAYNIDNRLQNIENLSNIVFMSEDTVNLLKYDENNESKEKQINELSNVWKFARNLEANKEVFRVRFFVDGRKAYSKERINFFDMADAEKMDWYEAVKQQNGRVVWRGNYKERYLDKGEVYITSCIRVLKDYRNLNLHIAMLAIDINEDVFYGILNSIEFAEKKHIYIVDENNNILFQEDRTRIGQKDDLAAMDLQSGEGVYRDADQNMVIFTTIPTAKWKIIARMPQQVLRGKQSIFSDSLNVTIIILLIFLLAIAMTFFMFTDGVVGRISKLMAAMETYGVDKYEDNAGESVNKVGMLYYKIDKMIVKSQKIIKESYEAKTKEREAQLKALQSQINPHFLYNTLDAINWMAKKGKMEETSFMVSALAKYFRLSLSRGRDIVCVKDEIELAKVYVDIQKMRFRDSFDIEFTVDEECVSCKVPKLILQPVIENALLHGIQKNNGEYGNISVAVMKDGERVMMSVTDNGIGMSCETIQKVLSNEKEKNSYGIYNVNERVKLFSGEGEYGVEIDSRERLYTTVMITVKAIL